MSKTFNELSSTERQNLENAHRAWLACGMNFDKLTQEHLVALNPIMSPFFRISDDNITRMKRIRQAILDRYGVKIVTVHGAWESPSRSSKSRESQS